MRKKIILIISIIFILIISGILFLKYSSKLNIQVDILNTPKPYFTSSRSIHTAFLSLKETNIENLNNENLNQSIITLFNSLKNNQKEINGSNTYQNIIYLLDPKFPAKSESFLLNQAQFVFPKAKIDLIHLQENQNELEIYQLLKNYPFDQSVFILQSYLNYTDFDADLLEIQKLHYENSFNNLTKSSLNSISFSDTEAVKALYQINKENSFLKSLPTLSDDTFNYQIKFLVEGKSPGSSNLTITFLSDIMLDRHVRKLMDRNSIDYPFEKLNKSFLQMNNLLVGNLEGPIASQRINTTKSIAFRFAPDILDLLKKYHFDALSIANNHALDMGQNALEETYQFLDEANIVAFGNPRGMDNSRIAKFEINNHKLALIGLNHTDFKLNKSAVITSIRELTEENYLVIPYIHWGIEYVHKPNNEQISLAHQFIDAGAIAVIGMHPHVVQSIEIYDGKPIFYSLGNTVFDQYFSEDTQEGLAVTLQITANQMAFYLFPTKSVMSQVQLMNPNEKVNFLAKLASWGEYDNSIKEQILKGKIVRNLSND